ncbi:hypothetical protein BJ912DRAFT_322380 [Pholiota molesta]|nr:hypothetical protein BJ912DRAFT_322380 [Pholiota molesta]
MGGFEGSFGALTLGSFFNTMLFGMTVTHYFGYWMAKPNDSIAIRSTIVMLLTNDVFQSAAMVYMAWSFSVVGATGTLIGVLWPYHYVSIGTAFTALLVHAIMNQKIYSMSGSPLLYGVLMLVCLAAFGSGFSYGVGSWGSPISVVVVGSLKSLFACWLVIQIILDIFTAGLAVYFLRKHRSGSRKNIAVIDRLIRGAIQMGVLPAIFAFAGLVTFVVQPHTDFYMVFIIPIGRLYTTLFMNSLNVREELKDRLLGNVNQDEGVNQVVITSRRTDRNRHCTYLFTLSLRPLRMAEILGFDCS